jgi:nitronate monooxygenase
MPAEEGVPIISFFWGQAGLLIEIAHRGGAKVLHTIASADAARRAPRAALSTTARHFSRPGLGSRGQVHDKVATMVLVPTVVDRVSGTGSVTRCNVLQA